MLSAYDGVWKMIDPKDYSVNLKRFEHAREQLDKYAELCSLLIRYENLKVEDAQGAIKYRGNMGRTSLFLDVNKWPTGEQVRRAVLEYHDALEMARNLYEALRNEGKHHGLTPPPPLP